MRLLLLINLIFFLIASFGFADSWLCGTPLLHQERPLQHLPEAVPAAPAAPVHIGQTERFFIHIPEAEVTATCIAKSKHLLRLYRKLCPRYAHRCRSRRNCKGI